MEVFYHHIYEYWKGVRDLILHTTSARHERMIVERLESKGIPYVIYHLGNDNINVFFGHEACINVIKKIDKPDLCDYTDEEDFILGIMLGYGRLKQCERYLMRRGDREVLVG